MRCSHQRLLLFLFLVMIFADARKYEMLVLPKFPAACPYSASWLVHVSFFLSVKFDVQETKLERTSFLMFYKASPSLQFREKEAYFVHHLSEYEHKFRRRKGSKEALYHAKLLSRAAMVGECANSSAALTGTEIGRKRSLAVIPFVGSQGKGHSQVNLETKLDQLMATVCACSRYFQEMAIGVASRADRDSIRGRLLGAHPDIFARVHTIHFNVTASLSNLPYLALTWAQRTVLSVNCANAKLTTSDDVFCRPAGHAYRHTLQPLNIVTHDTPVERNERYDYVYFTEADQIVRFDERRTFEAAIALANLTTFVAARRREKSSYSAAERYMEGLNHGRDCGPGGYILDYPATNIVH